MSHVRTPVAGPDRGLRLALLLARAGEDGLSVESLLIALDCSRASLYRSLDRLTGAGWPVETVRDGERVLYRLEGGATLQAPIAAPATSGAGSSMELVLSMTLDGKTAAEIANVIGIAKGTVAQYRTMLRKSGRLPPAERHDQNPGEQVLATMRDLIDKGYSTKEVARHTGYALSTVRLYLTGYKTEERVSTGYVESIAEMLNRGLRPVEIMVALDMTRSKVSGLIREAVKRGMAAPRHGVRRGDVVGPRLHRPMDPQEAKDSIVKRLESGPAPREDLDALANGYAYRWLDDLIREGIVIRTERGWYELKAAPARQASSPAVTGRA